MKQVRFYILLLVIAAPVLLAQTANAASPDASGLYVGAQLGDSVVGGLVGLQINESFSVEARYDYIDTDEQLDTTVSAYCVGLTGIGLYRVRFGKMAPFYIFMKAGYEQTTTETTKHDPGLPPLPPSTIVTTKEEKRVVVGAGVQYDFSKDVSGRVGMNAVGSDHNVFITAIYKF